MQTALSHETHALHLACYAHIWLHDNPCMSGTRDITTIFNMTNIMESVALILGTS